MSANTDYYDVGLLYATDLYPRQQLFQMNQVYTLSQIRNDELNMDICAVMDGETYCGSLTAPGARKVAHLFKSGYVVKIRITKVGKTQPPTLSQRLGRNQSWTHGRGDVWQEADEGNKADKDNKADKAGEGFDGQAESKSVPAEDSSSGQSSTE